MLKDLVVIFGVEMERPCAELTKTAIELGEGAEDQRAPARRAIDALARLGCYTRLALVAKKLGKGTEDRRTLARHALDSIKQVQL
jgi:hypothetical protein